MFYVVVMLFAWPAGGQADEGLDQAVRASCATCHADQAGEFAESVHANARIGCQDCHGGATSYDVTNQQLGADVFEHGAQFSGKPSRFDVPQRCASCHSDVALMNPYGLPANQLIRYRTSGHGKALFEKKIDAAAVCTDCHDVHAVFKSTDPRSWTNPVNIPQTCGKCHANEELMSEYGHSSEIMTEYQRSVHGKGLLEERDTAMPTCATCHGNHAAAPPGVASINAVCARCHPQADEFFLKSPHGGIESFARCIACHGGENGHDIRRATVRPALLAAAYAGTAAGLEQEQLIETLHPELSLLVDVCYECHDEDSDDASDVLAFKRSQELYRLIGESEIEYARVSNHVDRVARGVLLVEDEQIMMADAKTAVVELGPTQHSLNVDDVSAVTQRLRETTETVTASIAKREAGLAWRYKVLWPMWIFIVIFAGASYEKYRRLKTIHVKPLK